MGSEGLMLAERIAEIEGVEAVVLGGPLARDEARPDSDVDLGIYYRPDHPPSLGELRRLAGELDDRHLPDLVTDFGEWGPWINGGGWLRLEGRPVDWLYRDPDLVSQTIEECRAGRAACHYQPGHPHGFHNHIYAGEVHYCCPLYDPLGRLAGLKVRLSEYPPPLKRTLVKRFLWEADFALHTRRKPAKRGEVPYVGGCLFRCGACLMQALFALNERYFVNEKGSVKTAGSFALCPDGFEKTVSDVLAEPGRDAAGLRTNVRRFERLVEAVRSLRLKSARFPNGKRNAAPLRLQRDALTERRDAFQPEIPGGFRYDGSGEKRPCLGIRIDAEHRPHQKRNGPGGPRLRAARG
ncbi:MAG: nucleotidyltransferase family protein, partial [Rubrobacteraceae bacterium]